MQGGAHIPLNHPPKCLTLKMSIALHHPQTVVQALWPGKEPLTTSPAFSPLALLFAHCSEDKPKPGPKPGLVNKAKQSQSYQMLSISTPSLQCLE